MTKGTVSAGVRRGTDTGLYGVIDTTQHRTVSKSDWEEGYALETLGIAVGSAGKTFHKKIKGDVEDIKPRIKSAASQKGVLRETARRIRENDLSETSDRVGKGTTERPSLLIKGVVKAKKWAEERKAKKIQLSQQKAHKILPKNLPQGAGQPIQPQVKSRNPLGGGSP